jgi:two-component system LytT family sensor kinase
VAAPLVVAGQLVGSFVALYGRGRRVTPDDTRTVAEAASLVSAQLELKEMDEQAERLARAELRALRAQISPHFIYNALAAIAGYIHSSPDEARELLAEFAEFTRYAFRGQSPYVTLADELGYVEKYLRLERARFGDRLEVRLQVAPEVLNAVVPVLSVQPLVENAVRHGVERRGHGRIEIVGRDIDADVELQVSDNGVGMEPARAAEALGGQGRGVGIANVQARLQSSFGAGYGLEIDTAVGRGTTVTMTLPKFRAGVRAA